MMAIICSGLKGVNSDGQRYLYCGSKHRNTVANCNEYEDFPHSRAKPSGEDTVNHATGSRFVASIALKILAIYSC